MNRRTFVQTIGALAPVSAFANELQAQQQQQGKSVVISTWAGNTKANEQAWKQLLLNNNALDAVHQGVMVPEADPEDMSVGYGGLPDRDGIVTFDACIMDHLGNIGAVMAIEHIIHASSVARLVMEKTLHLYTIGIGMLFVWYIDGCLCNTR